MMEKHEREHERVHVVFTETVSLVCLTMGGSSHFGVSKSPGKHFIFKKCWNSLYWNPVVYGR